MKLFRDECRKYGRFDMFRIINDLSLKCMFPAGFILSSNYEGIGCM